MNPKVKSITQFPAGNPSKNFLHAVWWMDVQFQPNIMKNPKISMKNSICRSRICFFFNLKNTSPKTLGTNGRPHQGTVLELGILMDNVCLSINCTSISSFDTWDHDSCVNIPPNCPDYTSMTSLAADKRYGAVFPPTFGHRSPALVCLAGDVHAHAEVHADLAREFSRCQRLLEHLWERKRWWDDFFILQLQPLKRCLTHGEHLKFSSLEIGDGPELGKPIIFFGSSRSTLGVVLVSVIFVMIHDFLTSMRVLAMSYISYGYHLSHPSFLFRVQPQSMLKKLSG